MGAAINASFITGLNSPIALALSGTNLFVANYNSGTIGKYNATTGAVINANFITGLNYPYELALSGNNLFVTNTGSCTVSEYNATTGAVINANFITGLPFPNWTRRHARVDTHTNSNAWSDSSTTELNVGML
jgi:hypothetical protein